MKQVNAIVKAESGLHARPASMLVKKAAEFKAAINIEKDGQAADARRLLSVLTLGAKKGDTIIIKAEGEDEVAAAQAIKELIETSC